MLDQSRTIWHFTGNSVGVHILFCVISSKTGIVGQLSSSEILTKRKKSEAVKKILAGAENLCSTQLILFLSGESFFSIPGSESSGGFYSLGFSVGLLEDFGVYSLLVYGSFLLH